MPESITAIILTFNEEQHIARCIESIRSNVERICIVDSFSTDRTIEIAEKLGVEIFQNSWVNYATQFNWGLDNCNIQTDWSMRIDADEYLDHELQSKLSCWMKEGKLNVDALYLKRKIVFLGHPILHGFFYPSMMLRLWRTGSGRIEQRWMDEHVILENPVTETLGGDLVDENLNDLSWWINKHNGYATREVYDMVSVLEHSDAGTSSTLSSLTGQAARKRLLKEKLYARLPPTFRASLYFLYRYFIGRGFLDGKPGFYFHFMQAFWYRTLVEAKLFELQREAEQKGVTPYKLLQQRGVFS